MNSLASVTPRIQADETTFSCGRCGTMLRVPNRIAGIRGACPTCGEWLQSPAARERKPAPPPAPAFAAKQVIDRPPDFVPEPPRPRPEAGIDFRDRRRRRDARASWWLANRLKMAVAFLVVLVSLLMVGKATNWQLPWQLPPDSLLARAIDSVQGYFTSRGSESIPTGMRR